MYSAWWIPKDRESQTLTDHEALDRDEETHKSIQSDETVLRPLDLETIMSSKAAVKYWYLHRPKAMEYVHRNAVKIQSVGRSFAVRRFIQRHGLEYSVELAIKDAEQREKTRLAQMTEEEKIKDAIENEMIEKKRLEKKKLRRELISMEIIDNESIELHKYYKIQENIKLQEEMDRKEKERLELLLIKEIKEKEDQEKIEKINKEKEMILVQEKERKERENIEREQMEKDQIELKLNLKIQKELQENEVKEQERLKKLEIEQMAIKEKENELILLQKQKKEENDIKRMKLKQTENQYENSFGKNVPVTTSYGPAHVVSYDREKATYCIQLENNQNNNYNNLILNENEIELDDQRIISPRTQVETPFGIGSIVGLDPHAGYYAVNKNNIHNDDTNDTNDTNEDNLNNIAYIQISDVKVFNEKVEEMETSGVILDQNHIETEMPDEIGLISARIVDSRVFGKDGKKFVQYKLEIQTTNFGTLFCWKRYSTFRSLCERLRKEKGFKKKEIPELPSRHLVGNFSQKTIGERAEKLNNFLEAATKADHLQWGIRIDENIVVYKRRSKKV